MQRLSAIKCYFLKYSEGKHTFKIFAQLPDYDSLRIIAYGGI
jgi:hypothetical protein